jgi:hypothetical protein
VAACGLLVSATVVLVTLPAFLGDGRQTQPGNASLLPNRYGRSLALVLGLVWAAVILTGRRRGAPARRTPPGG